VLFRSHLENDAGQQLVDFLATHTGVTGSFAAGKKKKARGDLMGAFSSRGGTGQVYGISKPDITAPGVQILAGHTPDPDDIAGGIPGELFQVIQGTSMSSPHVAGAGALLKDLHPNWTPGQIKSALMTTSRTQNLFKEDGVTPSDPFDRGSGRLDLTKAGRAGITFDCPGSDFMTHKNDLWNVNYPSVYIPQMPATITVQRTAHSELTKNSTWKLTTTAPADLLVTVPATILVPAAGDFTFDITLDASAVPAGQTRHASLQLQSGASAIVLPITIVRAP